MIDSRNFHIFGKEKQHYLFLTLPVAVFKIDADTAAVLSKAEHHQLIKDAIEQKRLQEAEAFMDHYCQNAPTAKALRRPQDITEKVVGLTLFTCQECNLKCTYCYGDEGEYGKKGRMSEQTLKQSFDTFFNNYQGKHFVTLFGGEPLMNFSLVKKAADLKDKFRNEGKADISLEMVTNGTLCNDEIINFFEQHIDGVTFSLDGPESINDQQRIAKKGNSVYRQVSENIQKLTTKNRFAWSFRAIVTNQSCSRIEEIYDDLEKFHPGGIGISCADVPADSPLALSEEEYQNFVEQIIRINQKGLRSFVEEGQSIAFEYPYYILFHFVSRSHAFYHCNAGSNMLAVNAEGDVYPCHRFVGEEQFKMGNVADPDLCQNSRYREIRQQFIDTDVDHRDVCRKCWARYLCGGDCAKHSYTQSGDLNTPTKRYCDYMKAVIEGMLPDIIEVIQNPNTRKILLDRLESSFSRRSSKRKMERGYVA